MDTKQTFSLSTLKSSPSTMRSLRMNRLATLMEGYIALSQLGHSVSGRCARKRIERKMDRYHALLFRQAVIEDVSLRIVGKLGLSYNEESNGEMARAVAKHLITKDLIDRMAGKRDWSVRKSAFITTLPPKEILENLANQVITSVLSQDSTSQLKL